MKTTKVPDITPSELRDAFDYDRYLGILTWRTKPSWGVSAGEVAGRLRPGNRYAKVRYKKRLHFVHRIIWAWWHGEWPSGVIDHINRNPEDNRIFNLRDCPQHKNSTNSKMRKDNTTGFKGVCFHKCTGRYTAQIQHKKKLRYIGLYKTPEEAAAAYENVARELHKDFRNV